MKMVLLALADIANHEGECWPAVGTLGDMTSLGQSTIKAHIRALEEVGILQIMPRFTQAGRQTSNFFKICVENLDENWKGPKSGPSPKTAGGPAENQPPEGPKSGGTGGQPLTPQNRTDEPPKKPLERTTPKPPAPEPRRSGSCGGDAPPVQQAAIPLEFAAIVTGAAPPNDLPPADKDQCAVGPLQVRVGLLRGRRPNTPWMAKEIRQWKIIAKTMTTEDLELMELYYSAPLRTGEKDIRRRDLYTLLNNWAGELDRARAYKATLTPTPTNGRHQFNPDA